jgi:hypothetical protein
MRRLRAALLHRLVPHSLRAQFAVALLTMAVLIVAGGATAVYALHATSSAARQFSQERLALVQTAQDLQQRTQHIELLADRMIASDSGAAARRAYTQILAELDVLDQLTARLAVGEDESVLDLHQSSQLFRNSAHVLAQLRDAAALPGASTAPSAALDGYREELQAHARAMAVSARQRSDQLTREYQAAVLRTVEASHVSAYWVIGWLAFSLLAAWLMARVFLGRHVIAPSASRHRAFRSKEMTRSERWRAPWSSFCPTDGSWRRRAPGLKRNSSAWPPSSTTRPTASSCCRVAAYFS